jgi:lipoprotein-anchoring transpeptidase ErfK/SrfK
LLGFEYSAALPTINTHTHLLIIPMKTVSMIAVLSALLLVPLHASASEPSYKVVKGDTLYYIAKKHGVTVADLSETNGLKSDLIRPGQLLRLPVAGRGATFVMASPTVRTIRVNARQAPAQLDSALLNNPPSLERRVVVDLQRQRAFLLVGGEVAIDTPISSGKTSTPTRTGEFRITERVRSNKVSNRYHVVMPYWMRLGTMPIGLHAGHLPGYAASHGCIRLPKEVAAELFDATRAGTVVVITRNWTPPVASTVVAVR